MVVVVDTNDKETAKKNSWMPLTYVSDHPRDLQPLTPVMFLQETCTVGVPVLHKLDQVDLNKRLLYEQRLRADLRSRFSAEYLSQLLQHPKKSGQHQLTTGEIVLLGNEINPDRDRNAGVVKIKTVSGELIRPVQRIYRLEISVPVEELKA
ncbi:hypothetical protein PR048_005131 [Dryococelus australis]|uniref:DUF5641 domain-containing protein n=1 Tax=Dryococelus australis TaxID=614101 RepID=A0ABQ9I7D2_9NEOP|nr:hypothetical protein PR048_005131 [Dryococelus australis]